jgi:hypothetical protein
LRNYEATLDSEQAFSGEDFESAFKKYRSKDEEAAVAMKIVGIVATEHHDNYLVCRQARKGPRRFKAEW